MSNPVGNVDPTGTTSCYGFLPPAVQDDAPGATANVEAAIGQTATAGAEAMQYLGDTILTGPFAMQHKGGVPVDNWGPGTPMYQMVVGSPQAALAAKVLRQKVIRMLLEWAKAKSNERG